MNNDVPDNHDNKIIQFRKFKEIKPEVKTTRTVRSKAVGEEVEFVVMWPQDWEEEYWPSMYELENTIMTVKCYKSKLINKLATAGVSEEFKIREGLGQLDRMYEMLIFYLRGD